MKYRFLLSGIVVRIRPFVQSVTVTVRAPFAYSLENARIIITNGSVSQTSRLSLLVSSLVFLVFQVVILEGFNTTGRRLTATKLYEVQDGPSATPCLLQARYM